MWYSWQSQQAFDVWHKTVCDGLGLPRPGYNEGTGELTPKAQWTLRYTEAIEVNPTDWRAYVQPEIATDYPNGLGAPTEPPFTMED